MTRLLRCILLAVAIAVSCPVALIAQPAAHVEDSTQLIGLWEASRDFGPEIEGPLTISVTTTDARASVAGFETSVDIHGGDSIAFSIPGDRGQFVGRLSVDSARIDGQWIQPPTAASYVRYASPVHLTRLDANRWRGAVTPLDDRMTMHLLLYRSDSNTVSGILRNPEVNFGHYFNIARVVIDDGRVRCLEPGRTNVRLEGLYDSQNNTFSLLLPDAGGTFDFHRADDSTSTFYPRPLSDAPYVYRPPAPEADGWRTGSLGAVGMATGPIEELVRRIIDTPMNSIDAPYIHAVLIARHGTLVLEEYFHGYDGRTPHETRSASKVITSTLIGVGINRGLPISLRTPVYETMYDGQLPSDLDPRKRRMTVENLLTMTPGWDCDDGNSESQGNEERLQSQTEQPDWCRYTLDLPMVNEPGTVAAYCSGSPNVAAAVLSKATGIWLPEFFQRYLAAPLSMDVYAMNLTPVGEAYGGGGLYICPRDFLKIGQLMLDDGKWNGTSIVSPEWCAAATAPHVQMWGEGYGYSWWIIPYTYEGREVQGFYAGGNGGQYIIGIPELDLNIVFFAANYGQRVMHQTKREYVPEYILRSIEQGGR